MFKFQINNGVSDVTITLPSGMSEIGASYLDKITKNITPGDYYALVALIRREVASKILFAGNQKKDIVTSVVPVFVKAGKCEGSFVKDIKMGEKIIAAPTDLGLGNHVVAPDNYASIDKFLAACAEDTNAYTKCLTACKQDINHGECYFIEFKMVPVAAIHGVYATPTENEKFVNPFKPVAIVSVK